MLETDGSAEERNRRLDGPMHGFFGLTYSNYLVLHRSLMQSMPVEWQERAIAVFEELRAAFDHVKQADVYKVTPASECTYSDLSKTDMALLGVTQPDEPAGDYDDTWRDRYYDRDGNEHHASDRVLAPLPGGDPVPHYNRGRTFIEPRTANVGAVA